MTPTNNNYLAQVYQDGKWQSYQPSSNTINSSMLTPTPTINFTTPNQPSPYPVATLNQPVVQDPNALGPQGQQAQELTTRIQGLNTELTGQTDYRAQQQQSQGIPDLNAHIQDATSRLTALQNQSLSLQNQYQYGIPNSMQLDSEGRGRTAAGLASLTASELRRNQLQQGLISTEALTTASTLAAYQGQLTTALKYVDDAVAQKFGRQQEERDAAIANLQLILNSPAYSNEEKVRAQAQLQIQQQKDAALQQQKQDTKDVYALGIEAARNGADSLTVHRIQQATSPQQALDILTASGFATNPLDQQKQEADIAYTHAQTAKMYADAQQIGSAVGIDPANIIAYAQQYAATGNIPTGLPKGTFGAVSQIAKELPKPAGTLVDINTGIKPASLSATTENGISALYDVSNKLDELKTDFQDTHTGILAGTKNALFPSSKNQRYNDMRNEIIDLLARARTGAVINENELRTYEAKLPGNFNQSLFLGANGSQLIDDLKRSITGKLNATLTNNSTVIYGYSKVNIGGQQYTVGDIVTNAQGQRGRVNPDGSITITQ